MTEHEDNGSEKVVLEVESRSDREWFVIRAGLVFLFVIVVTAVAIPNLLAKRRGANQSNPVAAVMEVGSAQNMYYRTDWDGDGVLEYATSFPVLYSQKDAAGNLLRLISEALALATEPALALHGYYFVDITAHETDGPYVDASSNQRDDYGICAVPGRYPRSGRATYIMDSVGTVYAKDTRGKPVTIFPASPREDGWEVAE